MIPIDSTSDQNAVCRVFLRLHVHINDQTMHERRNLKLPYLFCYTRIICEICRAET